MVGVVVGIIDGSDDAFVFSLEVIHVGLICTRDKASKVGLLCQQI